MAPHGDIEGALEVIEFHARSANRVKALDVLTVTNGSIERRTLEEVSEISRPTLSRILDDFEKRGWVIQDHHRYEVTHLGEFVNQEFQRLIERMAVVQTLHEVVQWFPDDGYGFDLSRLSAADIVRPSKEDALAPTNNIVRRLETAEQVRLLSYTVLPVCFDVCRRKVVDGNQTVDLVFDSSALTTVENNQTLIAGARDLLDSGSATLSHYDGELPYIVIITDEVVNLCLSGKDGSPRAVIDTTDEAVRTWAETTFESYCRRATPLDSTLFTM